MVSYRNIPNTSSISISSPQLLPKATPAALRKQTGNFPGPHSLPSILTGGRGPHVSAWSPCAASGTEGKKPKSNLPFFFPLLFFFSSQSVSLAIVLIKQSPFIRGSLTHFISLLFCFEISRATINFREREREREFNKDLLLLSASIAVMKIYFLSLLCPI